MRLYVTPSGSWAGTQADARALAKSEGADWKEVDVPTDKPGLLTFLNENKVGAKPAPPELQAVKRTFPSAKGAAPMSASDVLSRMDNPGIDVDGIVETVSRSSGHALKRYAGAVALAFQNLSN